MYIKGTLHFRYNPSDTIQCERDRAECDGTVQNANEKQLLSQFSGGWGVRSNFPP